MGVKGTVQHQAPKDLAPARLYVAKLLHVKEKSTPPGVTDKLLWKFRILEPEEWSTLDDGRERFVYGEIWQDLNTRADCQWRNWHAAMLGQDPGEFDINTEIDTDQVTGLMCLIRVEHRSFVPRGETEEKWVAEVAEVLPYADLPDSDQPPY